MDPIFQRFEKLIPEATQVATIDRGYIFTLGAKRLQLTCLKSPTSNDTLFIQIVFVSGEPERKTTVAFVVPTKTFLDIKEILCAIKDKEQTHKEDKQMHSFVHMLKIMENFYDV